MAYTKIIAVKKRLASCVNYTLNPEKTYAAEEGAALEAVLQYAQKEHKTGRLRYVTGFHCTPESALQVMQNTKHRWHKDTPGYVQGYHIIQSFAPGEISPERCFQIGCEFAERYLADKYDVDADASVERANERIKRSTEDAFRKTVDGYDTVIAENTNVQLQNGQAKYALYPVWILNTTWNGQKYTFAMNGQTGKLVGDLPLDRGAYNKYLWMTTAIAAAAVFAVQYLIWFL